MKILFILYKMSLLYITNTFVNTFTDTFFIFCRNKERKLQIISKKAKYSLYFGFENISNDEKEKIIYDIENNKYSLILRKGKTIYRGNNYIYEIKVDKFLDFNNLKYKYDKYEKNKKIFQCNSGDSYEDMSKIHYNISGIKYIYYDNDIKITNEKFLYEPIVAAYDLEMFELDGLSPNLRVYMCSYICENKYYLIYTEDFLDKDLNVINVILNKKYTNIRCIKVKNMNDKIDMLASLIYDTRPDILTGYNIYNADNQLLFYILSKKLSCWPSDPITGITPYFSNTKKFDKHNIDSPSGFCMVIGGVSIIDMYIFLIIYLPSADKINMSLKYIAMKYVNDTKDDLDIKGLYENYYSNDIDKKITTILYCVKDSELTIRLYKYFNVWNYYNKIEVISGIDQQRILTVGSLAINVSWLSKSIREEGGYLDSPNTEIFKTGGGSVIEPIIGLHNNMHSIDLTSLYPSIVCRYNICPTTILYNYIEGMENYCNILKDANGNIFYFDTRIKGIIPKMLEKSLKERGEVKKLWQELNKDETKKNEVDILKGEELALKTLSNGLCGGFAEHSESNKMSFCLINDIITTKGREIFEYSKQYISSYDNGNIELIYGDTDGLFIASKKVNLSDMTYINILLSNLNKTLPEGICFKHEYLANKFIITKKKHYISVILNKDNIYEIKLTGYKAVKGSATLSGKQLFEDCIILLILYGKYMCIWYHARQMKNYINNININNFSQKFKYSGKSYKENSTAYKIVNNLISRNNEFIPGQVLDIIIMKTEYLLYKRIDIDNSSLISSRTFLTSEIDPSEYYMIDIEHILNISCNNDLYSILSVIEDDYYNYDEYLNAIFPEDIYINVDYINKHQDMKNKVKLL